MDYGKETMTPKERWLAVLNREKPDRIPMDYWATDEAMVKLMKHLGSADRWEMLAQLHIDPLVSVGPAYTGPAIGPDRDMYGCDYRNIRYETGVYRECVSFPLAQYESVEAIDANYTWPTADWFDYSVIPDQIEGKEAYAIRGGGSEPFLTYTHLRGMEQAFMDLMLNPEIVHYCLDKLYGFSYENTRRIYEAIPGKVNISYVAEDMGSQESLLFSPKQIRTFFIPWMKRMIDLAHEAGVLCVSPQRWGGPQDYPGYDCGRD